MAISTLFIVLAVVNFLFISCKWAMAAFHRRRFYLKHHCEAIPRGCSDPFLGIDRLVKLKTASEEKRYLQFSRENFDTYGATYACSLLLRSQVHTADPENFRAVLHTQFAGFDAGPRRAEALKPLFGPESTATTDGLRWKQARTLLRPGLSQKHVIDFDALEVFIIANCSSLLL
jgi:hypothetical protein